MSTTPELDWNELDDKAVDTVRVLAMDAVQKVGNGHPGTAMSLAPAAYLLFQKVMRHNPADPHWPGRDRFVLSCGHSSLTLYLQLFLGGWGLELEDIEALRTWGSKTPGHPEYGHTAGVETTTGPLGQGIGNAVGMAMAARRERGLLDPGSRGASPFDHQIYAHVQRRRHRGGGVRRGLGDRRRAAARQPHRSSTTTTRSRSRTTPTSRSPRTSAARYAAYGWHVQDVDWTHGGKEYREDVPALYAAIKAAEAVTDRPSFIVLRTIIAWPAPNAQNTGKAHGSALGADEVAATKEVLGFDPALTFDVDPEVHRAHPRAGRAGQGRAGRLGRGVRGVGRRRRRPQGPLRPDADPDPARGLGRRAADVRRRREGHGHPQGLRQRHQRDRRRSCPSCGAAPPTSPSPTTPPSRARRRSCRSTARTKLWSGDPQLGRVLHFGIREHGMGAIMNGIAVHGGTRVFGGTFLTFSDYMRGSVRLAALMGLPVTYVWTHDSIGLGEDGPTHQPIEHLAALRAIPGLDVVRPADANETAAAWRTILEQTDRPHGLILTRQNVPVFPRGEDGFSRHLQRAPRRLRAARHRRRRPTWSWSAPAPRSSSRSRRGRCWPRTALPLVWCPCRAASGSTPRRRPTARP